MFTVGQFAFLSTVMRTGRKNLKLRPQRVMVYQSIAKEVEDKLAESAANFQFYL